jgi:hypothetical protein
MRIRAIFILLALATGSVSAAEPGLRVGAARIDQTGPPGRSQSGKYDHERVYARAIVLDNGTARAALISYEGPEADFNMGLTLKGVAEALNCPLENVIISHTHTHSSRSAPSSMEKPVRSNTSKEILAAVAQAKAKLQPARMSFGTGASYLNVNRDAIDPATRQWTQGSNLDAPSDRTVAVLSFFTPSGEPIAVYVNYAMHPINGYVLGVVSADVPGAMSRHVEKAFGDNLVVAFSQGTSGDQSPLYLRLSTNAMATRAGDKITGFQMNREASEGPLRMSDMAAAKGGEPTKPAADPKAVDDLFRFIESEGQVLGEEVIRVMTFTKPPADEVRIAGAQKVFTCPGRKRTNGDPIDPKTRETKAVFVDAPPVSLRIGVLGLGTVALASINGEAYTLIGSRIKNEAPMKNTVITTLANERMNGYIPDDASYGHSTFQVLNSTLQPGCAETGITNAIVELETQYLQEGVSAASAR